MNNYFKVGCNFTPELADAIIELNNHSAGNKRAELFGSRKESHILTARPEFRLPEISREDFIKYIRKLNDNSIEFSYTLNSSYLGSKEEMRLLKEPIVEYTKFLIDAGVKNFIIALPYMAEIIREISQDVGIEVSTIAQIDTVSKAKIWYERYGINKICVGIEKNRDILFLQNLAKYCQKTAITPTLLANEFCGNGSSLSSCTTGCIYRSHCYQLHSIGYSEKDAIDTYPMNRCMDSRRSAANWLKLNFIRPEDMHLYNEIGINHFKITGRTGSTDHLIRIIQAYMDEKYEGNLLSLWKHLETIASKNDASFVPTVFINNRELDGFLDFWFSLRKNGCDNEVCGETCHYCETFLSKHVIQ